MPRSLKLVLPALLLGGYLFLIHQPLGSLPPPAKFFDPLQGFLQPAAGFTLSAATELKIPALQGSVKILLDRRGVPHVFAEHVEDLPTAVGYLHARERLFQMELIVRSIKGRLSEVVGARALPSDRFFLENGFRDAADRAMQAADRSHPAYHALENYTAGINTFIAQLTPADYPLEFKLLDFAPSRWEPQNSSYLLKYMARQLAWYGSELAFDRLRANFSAEILQELFPVETTCPAPIYPGLVGSSSFRSSFADMHGLCLKASPQKKIFDDRDAAEPPLLGSNNWAIGATKSASGHAILANDPHLSHTFPNYWYEVDLHAPGLDVYGMTLPGSPDVII